MIWVITNKVEEDGSFPTYRYYKEAFGNGEINIYCAEQYDNFPFIGKEDIVIIRTRDENINMGVSALQKKFGFISTLESPLTNHLTHDKNAVKEVLRSHNIPFPETINLCNLSGDGTYFVKPLLGENSSGIDSKSICRSKEEAIAKYNSLLKSGQHPIIEEYIDGIDVTTAVFNLNNGNDLRTYSIITIPSSGNIQTKSTKGEFSFTAIKYDNKMVGEMAKMIFNAVGAKHLLRIDFRIRNGMPYVVDINMIPGLAPNGYMSMCMKEHGIPYFDFIRMMVDTAS